jgi:diacylglycerol kinase (ATP)
MPAGTLVVFNLKAGRFGKGRVGGLLQLLRDAGVDAAPVEAGEVTGATLVGRERVIVCGGDGTVHQLLPLILEARLPLGLVPMGTGNVLARELAIPRRLEAALGVALGSKKVSLSLGSCNGRPFLLMTGAGVDAHLSGRVGPALKQRLGILAYWIGGFTSFWSYPLPPFQVQLEDECIEGTQAVVANGRFYGGGLQLTPGGDLSRPGFEVCVFRSRSHLRYPVYLAKAFFGRHLALKDVVYRKSNALRIEGDPAVPIQLDGEPSGGLPVVIEVLDRRVEVFVG